MMNIEETERECAANAVAPRVSLSDIEGAITDRYHFTAAEVLGDRCRKVNKALELLSICILVMKNGFTIIGKSAPASPENFNALLGEKLAYDDAIRQLWPLMGFSLRDRLSKIAAPSQEVISADQNERLAHIQKMIELGLEVGGDGWSAICEQTGKQFITVVIADETEADACRGWLRQALAIRGEVQPKAEVIYWRLRPVLSVRGDGRCEVYGRLCFG